MNPRDFQITQVIKRFSPERIDGDNGTTLTFKIIPSDPDFPFELSGLECELTVPTTYTQGGTPILRVKNAEIPRGYQINVEKGFDSLVTPRQTLLAMLNELDKNLEQCLTAEKAQTVKLVANTTRQDKTSISPVIKPSEDPKPVAVPSLPTYSAAEQSAAQSKRHVDVRQLEARMSRTPLFSKSSDGTSFNVPVQIPKPGRLPVSLRELKVVTLNVPTAYNLQPCTVKLNGVVGEASQNAELAFEIHARQETDLTLMAHINHLTQNLHTMATEAPFEIESVNPPAAEPVTSSIPPNDHTNTSQQTEEVVYDPDRPHLKLIPRPPEWDHPASGSDGESSEFDDSDEFTESEDDAGENEGGASLPVPASVAKASGSSIVISFPGIELYGVELLEVASLCLTLKCDRCKTTVDIKNLKPNSSDSSTSITLTESCPKCAATLAASYHAEPLHANSIKGGHLDLTSCTISDMLPSTFTPTCSECSTAYPTPPGVISVRGESTLAVCRNCHRKMTFKIPEVKFLRVAAHASDMPLPPRRRKVKENLGITAGTPLPNFGKCSHYRKSHRWFRFSCCSKVYPCDRCHDEQADPKHPNEHANRMLCGYCSREQNYRPEDCGVCGKSLVGRRGVGFWEGGKGTRDKSRMSRKDPRKYKRRGGTVPRGS